MKSKKTKKLKPSKLNKIKRYKRNHSLVYSCRYHVIFSTKYRRKVLGGKVEMRLKELIFQKQPEYNFEVLEMEVMPDHVHLLLDVNPQVGIIKVVGQIKGWTSHQLRKEFPYLKRLPSLWTRSKFIETVGVVGLSVVRKYIRNQKKQ